MATANNSITGPAPRAEYRRIEQDMRERINTGQWSVGSMLASRRTLAREYAVSPVTIERAIAPLLADGTLRADDRRGTFVARGIVAAGGSAFERDIPLVSAPKAVIGIVALDSLLYRKGSESEQENFGTRLIVRSVEHALSECLVPTRTCLRASPSGGDPMPLGDAISRMIQDKVNAIALICFDRSPAEVDEVLAEQRLEGLPLTCVVSGPLQTPVPHVFYDNRLAGYQAFQHLHSQGLVPITVFAPFTASWVRERLEGMSAAHEQAGLPADALQVISGPKPLPWNHEENPDVIGYRVAREALDQGWTPSGGVIGINDGVTFGVLRAASESGKEAGVDYAALGFDDHPKSRGLRLSDMRPPVEAMGREAALQLLQALRQEPVNQQVRLNAHLIARASTAMSHGRAGTD